MSPMLYKIDSGVDSNSGSYVGHVTVVEAAAVEVSLLLLVFVTLG